MAALTMSTGSHTGSGFYPPATKYTTADEISHVRKLIARGDVEVLRRYLFVCRNRTWSGRGMEVDPGQVILFLEDAINHITAKAKLDRAMKAANEFRKTLGLPPLT